MSKPFNAREYIDKANAAQKERAKQRKEAAKKVAKAAPAARAPKTGRKQGRNEACSCGSKKKYKRCHGG